MKITLPFVRSAYNYDPRAACEECCVQDFGPTLTQQSQAEEADINTIVKRFNLTGQLPENIRAPTYADYDDVYDFKTAMDAIKKAEDSFRVMPPAIRARFDNDPAKFVDYCSDERNLPELREMGLAMPAKPTEKPPEPTTGSTGAGAAPPGQPS
ncbi:MAG: internal scaffolding protein [Microvirus sp.]|nr:MAG: internal scaffolding protein [Microvirus sp.]